MHGHSGNRMREIQFPCVQRLSGNIGSGRNRIIRTPQIGRIVERIACERMVKTCHVHTNLMRTAGLKLQLEQRSDVRCGGIFDRTGYIRSSSSRQIAQCLIMRDGAFAIFGIDAAFDERTRPSADGCIHGSGGICFSLRDGEVCPVDLASQQCLLKDTGGDNVFCHDQKTRRIAVETIDAPENERDSLLLVIPDNAVAERILRMTDRRMDRQTGGLVHNENIFVFIGDAERDGRGYNILR